MIQKVFSVFDQKAQVYSKPFFCPNEGVATRSLIDVMRSEEHEFSKYAEDFVLFELGQFDDDSGMLEPLQEPQVITRLMALKGNTEA